MTERKKEPWTTFQGSRSRVYEETKEIDPASNETTGLLNDERRQNGKKRADVGRGEFSTPSIDDRNIPPPRTPNSGDTSCCDDLTDFCLNGFCPPESEAGKDKKRREWKFWHCWHPTANLKQIFVRDRDSNLNCLDGIRYTLLHIVPLHPIMNA